MGGGPPSADVVQSSCLVTFPEEAGAEPVPVDAWYLHAVGLTFLRRVARDRVGDAMRIALVMQLTTDSNDNDSDNDEETHSPDDEDKRDGDNSQQLANRPQAPASMPRLKRYVSVSSDAVLRRALQETFDQPEKVLVLHVISLEKVPGATTIHVRPEIHPNVSPEPVAPMALVFPTLHVDGAVTRVPAASEASSLLALASSYALSKSVYVPPPRKEDSVFDGKTMAHSTSALVEEREYTWRGADRRANYQQVCHDNESPSLPFAAVPHKTQSNDTVADASVIPMARVVGHVTDSQSSLSTASSESDYVMLELQTGAGMGELSTPSSTYFISSMWHVQAEEMGASMRLSAAVPQPRWPQQADNGENSKSSKSSESGRAVVTQEEQDDRAAVPLAALAVGLEESFVMLEQHPREEVDRSK